MFDPQKLLGQLLNGQVNLKQVSNKINTTPNKIAGLIALGGVALATYQQYQKSANNSNSSANIPPPPPPSSSVPTATPAPPLPPLSSSSSTTTANSHSSPSVITLSKQGESINLNALFANSPPPPKTKTEQDKHALLLIRAMIASAYADGVMDADEKQRIMDKLQGYQISTEEQQFLSQELSQPTPLAMLLSQVEPSDMELAKQFYFVSLLAIEIDTDAERQYIANLKQQLGLTPEDYALIEQQVSVIN